ncbi:MAG TPA: hypothetical protein VLB47_00365 [Solirubrobacteraceae bacterium]|nr:hypothetical protein [Solirubrobacteraceae bacterium]
MGTENPRSEGMPHHRTEPTANALARGPAKTDDIESTRRHLDRAERSAARELHAIAARHEDEVKRRQRLVRRLAARAGR